MNKLVSSLVAGLILVGIGGGVALAQERPFDFGFRAGVAIGSQSPDPGETDGSRVGITAGGVIGFPLTPNVAIETGLLYELRGAKYSDSRAGVTVESTTKLDYLVIPAVARMTFGTADGPQPFVLGGLDLGILMKAEAEAEGGAAVDIKDNLKSTDLGLRFGGGVNIPAGGYSWVLGLAYSLGLTDIVDLEGDAGSVKNRTLSFTGGINF